MAESWILNASPLIVLARIGREDLILGQADQAVVPEPVAIEIQVGPAHDQARQILTPGRFTIVDAPSPPPKYSPGSGQW